MAGWRQHAARRKPGRRVRAGMCLGWLLLGGAALAGAEPPAVSREPDPARRQAYLQQLLKIIPPSGPWTDWLKKTGELPPDFSVMPDLVRLPDPLRFSGGKEATAGTWALRRVEMLTLLQHYVLGRIPPSPGNVRSVTNRSRAEAGALIDQVVLGMGPEKKARLRLELILPKLDPPFPVLLVPQAHRDLALVAVSRGYAACVYAAGVQQDDTADWGAVWPEQDWTTPTRRAWAASRCLDYLQRLPVVDTNRFALFGHGENGKAALIAAAVDRRFRAVIASSSGAAGVASFRHFSEAQFGQGIEPLTRHHPDWVHPRLRFFVGREHKLPVDTSWLLACIAPRSCLIAAGLYDAQESIWAVERTYDSARRAYQLLGMDQELNMTYRPAGKHLRGVDIEGFVDWLDTVFGKGFFPFPGVRIHPTRAQWEALRPEPVDPLAFTTNQAGQLLVLADGTRVTTLNHWAQKREEMRQRVLWSMGMAPPFAESSLKPAAGQRLVGEAELKEAVPLDLVRRPFRFGNFLRGNLYQETNHLAQGMRRPAVVWVHPQGTAAGYAPSYFSGEPPHVAMARKGFAVLAFDQIGHGQRLEEVEYFYNRYPLWSLAGKQVEDTLAAVEALMKSPGIDPKRVYVVGFGSGGAVALHAGALDERIAGVVAMAGVIPLRRTDSTLAALGLTRWSLWHPWLPRLGAFIQHRDRTPYDYEEILAMMAPRPVLVVTPRLDYHTDSEAVQACVEEAGVIYDQLGAPENLLYLQVEDYRRLSPRMLNLVCERLRQAAGLRP